jgi:hypothetical protein
MEIEDIGTAKLAYRIFGSGKVRIVIEAALCSCSAEWWHIAQKLSDRYTVLVYDRAGYGTSTVSKLDRTPLNIARELYGLLNSLEISERLVLIGHSQGGLYVQQFARLYPEMVEGVLLLDPLSADDNRFKELLSEEEYRKSGVDKVRTYKLGAAITGTGLGFLLRPLLKKAPPFFYKAGFSNEAETYIMACLTKPRQYKTAIAEYELSHSESEISHLKRKGNFPEIPMVLVTHNSEISINESIYYGNTTRELAQRVETIWQELMMEYLSFSSRSSLLQAKESSHYIHLTEEGLVEEALKGIMQS